jgi:2-oxoglutarate ferredoxin oxidoreductase subunit gamma
MYKKQIIFGGCGGQGIILSGIITADAAALDGLNVVETQNYGPESRGGASRSDVIISDADIYYPEVINADIMVLLSQESYERYRSYANSNTIIISDEDILIKGFLNVNKYNIIKYAYNNLKKPFTVNMISLGILQGLTEVVSFNSMKSAIEKNVPGRTFDINFNAFLHGTGMVNQRKRM